MRRLLTELTHWYSSQLQIELGPIHTAVHTEIWVVPHDQAGRIVLGNFLHFAPLGWSIQKTIRTSIGAEKRPWRPAGRGAWRSEFRGLPSRQVQRSGAQVDLL